MGSFILQPHQEKTVQFGVKHNYCIYALEMGLGKSLSALATWQRTGGRLLIVCPAYLVLNWKNEVRKFMSENLVVSCFTEGRQLYPLWDTDICIVSYDLLKKAQYLFEWADMVVADEATELMNMKSQRSDMFHRGVYENSIKRLLLLTGTPIKNRVEEYFSLISLCNYNPKLTHSRFLNLFPDSVTFADHFSFRQEYDIFVGSKLVKVIKWEGVRNVAELKEFLKDIYIRFESKDVLDLPPITYKDILISEDTDTHLLNAFNTYVSQNKAVTPDVKRGAAGSKVPFTYKYAKELLKEVGQLVIYSDHQAPVQELASRFGVRGITGATPVKVRNQIETDFQAGTQKVIVATIGSFSTGVNLTAANNIVVNDFPWVPGDLDQMSHRIQRIGQTKPCVVHRVLGSPQDAYILKVIESKKNTIAKVV